jgi:glycosyltransferase involved in cell wall biosynthesis
MKGKILFIISDLTIGGAEKFLLSLTNYLSNNGYLITIICLNDENPLENEFNKNINLLYFKRSHKFDLSSIRKIRGEVKNQKFDFVICINFFTFFITALSTSFLSISKIISLHTTIAGSKKKYYQIKYLYARLLNKSDHLITVSNNQAKYISKTYHIPFHKFTTIHNGIDTTHWSFAPDGFDISKNRGKYEIPSGAKVIIIAANLRPEKNHITAIRALQLLHSVHDNYAYLFLIGDGDMKDKIVESARDLNLNGYIKFAGFQNDLRPFYWMSDLFTLTSDKVETLSIAALEAMACGLPCVLTNIGGANELIIENKNGFLSETNENDIALKWNKALNTTFSKNEIRDIVIRNFNVIEMTRSYLGFLENHKYK